MEETQLLKPCVLLQAVSSMVIKGQELLSFFDLFLVSDDGRRVCQQHPADAEVSLRLLFTNLPTQRLRLLTTTKDGQCLESSLSPQFILVHYHHANDTKVAEWQLVRWMSCLARRQKNFRVDHCEGVGAPEIVVRNGQPFAQNI